MVDIKIDEIGGYCPCQATGRINGHKFYFRSRGSHASIGIGGDDPVGDPDWELRMRYSTERYAAGYMEDDEATALIMVLGQLWESHGFNGKISDR